LREEEVEDRELPALNFSRNCVIIDEVGFNLHIAKKLPSLPKRHSAKDIAITIRCHFPSRRHGWVTEEAETCACVEKAKSRYITATVINGLAGTTTGLFSPTYQTL
jgi:hypothetical protein